MRTQSKTRLEPRRDGWSAGQRALSALLLGAALCACSTAAADAQAAPHMFALVTPPATVGTCKPPGPDTAYTRKRSPDMRVSRLLMMTRDPGGERDISAYVSRTGVMGGYSELVIRNTAIGSSEGEMVFAQVTSTGEFTGFIAHHTITSPPPDFKANVPIAQVMRDMEAHSKRTTTRAALSVNERARVSAMANWLIHRCPPQ